MKHPSWQEWIDFVRGGLEPDREAALTAHAGECDACRNDLEVVRRLQSAGAVGPLVDPPDALLDEVARRSAETAIPDPPTGAESVEWELADVRGADAAAAGESVYMARSLPGVSMSVMVMPPGPDRKWVIEGRLWMEDETQRGPIRLILAHHDHVLVDLTIDEGDRFHIAEVAEPGWKLELHLPDRRTLLVEDPFA